MLCYPAGIRHGFYQNFKELTFLAALNVQKRRSSRASYRSLCEACAQLVHRLCEATGSAGRTKWQLQGRRYALEPREIILVF